MSLHKFALLAVAPVLFACAPHDPIEDEFKKRVAFCQGNLENYEKFIGQKFEEVEFPKDQETHHYELDSDGSVIRPAISIPGLLHVVIDDKNVIKSVSCEQE